MEHFRGEPLGRASHERERGEEEREKGSWEVLSLSYLISIILCGVVSRSFPLLAALSMERGLN